MSARFGPRSALLTRALRCFTRTPCARWFRNPLGQYPHRSSTRKDPAPARRPISDDGDIRPNGLIEAERINRIDGLTVSSRNVLIPN